MKKVVHFRRNTQTVTMKKTISIVMIFFHCISFAGCSNTHNTIQSQPYTIKDNNKDNSDTHYIIIGILLGAITYNAIKNNNGKTSDISDISTNIAADPYGGGTASGWLIGGLLGGIIGFATDNALRDKGYTSKQEKEIYRIDDISSDKKKEANKPYTNDAIRYDK